MILRNRKFVLIFKLYGFSSKKVILVLISTFKINIPIDIGHQDDLDNTKKEEINRPRGVCVSITR